MVLTSHHDDDHIFPALRAGAISYLLKTVKIDELAAAIQRAARGGDPAPARGREAAKRAGRPAANPFAELTDREIEILKLIAQGLSSAQILERLVVSENTGKGHVSNVLSKLHLADRTHSASRVRPAAPTAA